MEPIDTGQSHDDINISNNAPHTHHDKQHHRTKKRHHASDDDNVKQEEMDYHRETVDPMHIDSLHTSSTLLPFPVETPPITHSDRQHRRWETAGHSSGSGSGSSGSNEKNRNSSSNPTSSSNDSMHSGSGSERTPEAEEPFPQNPSSNPGSSSGSGSSNSVSHSPSSNISKVSARRAQQNRAAQRAFRLRKEEYVKTLEARTRHLEDRISGLRRVEDKCRDLTEEVHSLESQRDGLGREVTDLRGVVGGLKGRLGWMEMELERWRGWGYHHQQYANLVQQDPPPSPSQQTFQPSQTSSSYPPPSQYYSYPYYKPHPHPPHSSLFKPYHGADNTLPQGSDLPSHLSSHQSAPLSAAMYAHQNYPQISQDLPSEERDRDRDRDGGGKEEKENGDKESGYLAVPPQLQ